MKKLSAVLFVFLLLAMSREVFAPDIRISTDAGRWLARFTWGVRVMNSETFENVAGVQLWVKKKVPAILDTDGDMGDSTVESCRWRTISAGSGVSNDEGRATFIVARPYRYRGERTYSFLVVANPTDPGDLDCNIYYLEQEDDPSTRYYWTDHGRAEEADLTMRRTTPWSFFLSPSYPELED